MSSADERRDPLDALAGSVSDDRPVDWDGAESSVGSPAAQASVRALREVSKIAEFNRELQRSPEPGSAAGAATETTEPKRWGDLLLLEQVGSGMSGQVWRAWEPKLQREVAVKLLNPRPAEAGSESHALLEEARALARVRHPNVVTVFGAGEFEGHPGLWMEFLRGETLDKRIERQGALPPAEVARIGLELARALAAVHAAGLVHRDLKPANVLIESDGRVVLTDFGLGQRRFVPEAERVRIPGTPMFMSPERLDGQSATPRSDLYALGATLWSAIAGKNPFTARTLAELEAESRRGPSTALHTLRPEAPAALTEAIERAMAPDPNARFASAGQLAAALEPFASRDRRARRRSSHPAMMAFAAALIATVALLVFMPRWLAQHTGAPAPSATAPAPARGAAPSVATTYDVEATLVSRSGGGYRRLSPGDRVRPGDRLSLEFRSSRPAWVYVLNEDERGESYLLFPQPLFDRANPVSGDSLVVLPGTVGGKENAWTVTSRGGREHFLVVASPHPVPEIEAELSRLPAARPDRPIQYAAIPAPTVERLRGVGGVAPLPADSAPRRSGAFERFEELAGRETGVHGVWVRQLTLENPLR
ncbi:MAG TPA: serine/threonine-protein kinase [Candidatus Sulfotelmatobacter sp.]|nr:serine/threonine-protein kinase [Candidatus Sulfotelmatobacter sp.]